jgi:hypothetical protein
VSGESQQTASNKLTEGAAAAAAAAVIQNNNNPSISDLLMLLNLSACKMRKQ